LFRAARFYDARALEYVSRSSRGPVYDAHRPKIAVARRIREIAAAAAAAAVIRNVPD